MQNRFLIDTHAHFDDFFAANEIESIIERARLVGLKKIIAIGGSDSANELAVSLAKKYTDFLYAAIGYDRDRYKYNKLLEGDIDIKSLEELYINNRDYILAIGEIGLDYYYDADKAVIQKMLFKKMLNLASKLKLPVLIHSREAENDTLELLNEYKYNLNNNIGVLHCFTSTDLDFVDALIDLNFAFSFSGIITFKNADKLRKIAKIIPDELLLVETDCPYLAPEPYRGTRNEPSLITYIIDCLADIRGSTKDKITYLIAENAARIFKWKWKEN